MLRGKPWKLGILWWIFTCALGVIEIVEEERCDSNEFRLTCRNLETHIAILEAWFTSINERMKQTTNHSLIRDTRVVNDSQLNDIYFYTRNSNDFYELSNSTIDSNDSIHDLMNEMNGTSEQLSDVTEVISDCEGFMRSYGSWREGVKGRRVVKRVSSINLRAPFSYRCTGVNHCNFILAEDIPHSASWGPGVVYVKYACFDDFRSIHYCNREVMIAETGPESEGYIRTPGYPHFYMGGQCSWRLSVSNEQRIRVTVMDISLRSIGPFESECVDYVTIRDSNEDPLLSSCNQVDLPLRLTSETNVLDISVNVKSDGAFPKRGVLLHYKSIGCVTLPAPPSGYLVYRNGDVAHYMCNAYHVFPDTRQRARLIWCYEDNSWNNTVPNCVEESSLSNDGNSPKGYDSTGKITHDEGNMLVDIVIPSLLIAALFIGNAFIVLIIYKYRKRKNDCDCQDEFNTIPLNASNGHSAGNAV